MKIFLRRNNILLKKRDYAPVLVSVGTLDVLYDGDLGHRWRGDGHRLWLQPDQSEVSISFVNQSELSIY